MPKRLPILILLDSHIDNVIAECIEPIIKSVIDKGYNTFCLETPSAIPIGKVKLGLQAEIVKIETNILPSVTAAINKGIQKAANEPKRLYASQELIALNLQDLVDLIKLYMPEQKNYEALAIQLRSHFQYKVTQHYLDILSPMIKMVGVDVNDRNFAVMEFAQHNTRREQHIGTKVLELYSAGANIVLKVGKTHAPGLFKFFSNAKHLDQIVFINLSSPDTCEPPYTPPDLALMEDPSRIHKLYFESAKSAKAQCSQIGAWIDLSIGKKPAVTDARVNHICLAAQKNNVTELEKFFESNRAFNFDTALPGGFTALDYACKSNSREAAEWLISKGCNLYNAGTREAPKIAPINRCNAALKAILEMPHEQDPATVIQGKSSSLKM